MSDTATPGTARPPVTDWATDFDHTHPDYAARAPEIWDELRERCPVAHTDRFGGAWLPTRAADVRAVAEDTEHFTSRMVVVSGTSDTHIRSITEKVYDKLREQGIKPLRKDPGPGGGWLILDYGDVVFHAMLEEKRQFYDLETLWNTMQPNPDLIE